MAERVIIIQVADHLVSLPFAVVEEIQGADRLVALADLPEGSVPGDPQQPYWVFSRGKWLPVDTLLPGFDLSEGSQIVVASWEGGGRAFAVDHVLGIEVLRDVATFPERARHFTDIPISGVQFWRKGPVLELDLSRLI